MSDKLERPSLDAVLPSLGLPYDGKIPAGKVKVYSMKTTDEKLFGGVNKRADLETVLDSLITRCTNIEGVKASDLLIGDRVYLMIQVRMASYGTGYSFQTSCRDCNTKATYQIDMSKDLESKMIDEDTYSDPFEVILPYSSDSVRMRLFTGEDERKILKYVDTQMKAKGVGTMGDPGYVYRLALHIVSVNSSDPSRTIEPSEKGVIGAAIKFIENLDSPDSSALRDAIEANTPGLDMKISLTCRACGNDFEVGLPMSADFFRSNR